MNYKTVHVTSRVTGEIEEATLFLCDECGGDSFTIFQIGTPPHPHLQCTKCDTTHCQGDCAGASELSRSKN